MRIPSRIGGYEAAHLPGPRLVQNNYEPRPRWRLPDVGKALGGRKGESDPGQSRAKPDLKQVQETM